MKRLANLTLNLSKELSRLDARCRSDLAAADQERDRALVDNGAKSILIRYHQDLEKAKQNQLRATETADDTRDRETRAAEAKSAAK